MPTVSVILPTYNRAHCLERAVRSIAVQSFEDWELIIVDDGSTDETEALCVSFRDRLGTKLRYYKLANGGVSRARNFGIEQAKSPLVAFQDSDDFWCVDKLGLQVQALERSGTALFSFTSFMTFDDDGTIIHESHGIPGDFEGRIYPDLLRISRNVIVTPSVLCSREIVRTAGGFDPNMRVCEDLDLWARVCSRTRAVGVRRPLVGVHLRMQEGYPFKNALEGRVTLYRKAILRDPGIGHKIQIELFTELFELFRTMGSPVPAVFDAANRALACVDETLRSGELSHLNNGIQLLRDATALLSSEISPHAA